MEPSAGSVHKRWVFLFSWAIGTTVTYALAGFVFHFPSAFPPSNGDRINWEGAIGALINGLLTGLLVAGVQYFLLRMVRLQSWRWIVASMVALWLTHTLGDVLSDDSGLTFVAIFGGLILGALQWWALRWPLSQGIIWLASTEFAWILGIWLGYAVGSGISDWRTEHVVVGIAAGLALSLANTASWLWILARRRGLVTAVVP